MIHLAENDALAKGGGRTIYPHPDDDNIVIKIHHTYRKGRMHAFHLLFSSKRRRFRSLINSMIEVDEFAAIVARNEFKPQFISQFLGFTNTTIGVGAMFEAIRNPNGALADTLLAHAASHEVEPAMIKAIDEFWDAVIASRAAISDSNLSNLVVTGNAVEGYELVLIDGLGDQTFIPLQSFSKRIHNARADRKREKMKQAYRDAVKG